MLGMKSKTSVRSTIGAGMRVTGDCHFTEGLQIDGTVLGDVSADTAAPSVLLIGAEGQVEGAISADRVVIAGAVTGPVLARELLELHSTARVQGDVRYKSLEMQPGAVIAGQLQPQLTPPPAPREAAAPADEAREPTFDPQRP